LTAVNWRPRQKEDFAHPTSEFFAAFESNLRVVLIRKLPYA
jgi:hypothetical protein